MLNEFSKLKYFEWPGCYGHPKLKGHSRNETKTNSIHDYKIKLKPNTITKIKMNSKTLKLKPNTLYNNAISTTRRHKGNADVQRNADTQLHALDSTTRRNDC